MTRNRLLLPIIIGFLPVAVSVIVATGNGQAKKGQPLVPADSALSLKHTALGQILIDAHGRTLYLFAGDKHTASTLSGPGRAVWPPFASTTPPRATGGVLAAQVGTATSTNGGPQIITYNGHPRYYYLGDHKAGQTLGQGLNEFGGRWYVLSARGGAITSAPQTAARTAAP